jgi:hypothetical protein
MVDMVLLPSACGSIHFPARPGSACWPATSRAEGVVNEAMVGVASSEGGNMTGGGVADERVADGSGDGDGMVAAGVGVSALHAAIIAMPAMAPMTISQNFLCICIYFLHF